MGQIVKKGVYFKQRPLHSLVATNRTRSRHNADRGGRVCSAFVTSELCPGSRVSELVTTRSRGEKRRSYRLRVAIGSSGATRRLDASRCRVAHEEAGPRTPLALLCPPPVPGLTDVPGWRESKWMKRSDEQVA